MVGSTAMNRHYLAGWTTVESSRWLKQGPPSLAKAEVLGSRCLAFSAVAYTRSS